MKLSQCGMLALRQSDLKLCVECAMQAANAPLVEPAPATAGAPKMSWRERALLKKQHLI